MAPPWRSCLGLKGQFTDRCLIGPRDNVKCDLEASFLRLFCSSGVCASNLAKTPMMDLTENVPAAISQRASRGFTGPRGCPWVSLLRRVPQNQITRKHPMGNVSFERKSRSRHCRCSECDNLADSAPLCNLGDTPCRWLSALTSCVRYVCGMMGFFHLIQSGIGPPVDASIFEYAPNNPCQSLRGDTDQELLMNLASKSSSASTSVFSAVPSIRYLSISVRVIKLLRLTSLTLQPLSPSPCQRRLSIWPLLMGRPSSLTQHYVWSRLSDSPWFLT